MIAADTSSFVCYLSGVRGGDVDMIRMALRSQNLMLPPVVLTEVISAPELSSQAISFIESLPLLDICDGYWIRAGNNRTKLLKRNFKAKVADSLIAQSCIDAGIPLITRDKDFRHFAKYCELILPPNSGL